MTNNTEAAGQYGAEIVQLSAGRVSLYRLLRDGRPLPWSDVVNRWQDDQCFRSFFISLLGETPFPAYFWETPPLTSATINREFEFVLVDSRQLAGVRADPQTFASHFASAQPGASVIEFSNLGEDATLVVPCPSEPLSAYSHMSTFTRLAPDEQQHQLWTSVGAALEQRLGTQPVWLSTSGLGVYWLHIRLDSSPKYYTHEPYRNP